MKGKIYVFLHLISYELMNLAIDIGNSRIKTAVFKDNTMVNSSSYLLEEFSENINKILKKFSIDQAIISSVGNFKSEYVQLLNSLLKVFTLTHQTKLPFINKYRTPESLGVDRIALVAAAINQFPDKNVLIFDVGSCITYDFVNEKKEYLGGAISPGLEMRYKALNSFTANLPELKIIDEVPMIGNTTEDSIHLGVLNGVILEIQGVIDQFKEKKEELTVVLTGGDTIFLAKNLKSTIFANPNFLLEGLNSILIYNKEA